MIHRSNASLLFSPSDLVSYLEGDFAAWCERMKAERGRAGGAGSAELEWVTPDEDEELELVARKGLEHESRFLATVRARESKLVEIGRGESAAADTLAAMRAGAPVIYQGHLIVGDWHGYPDFLFRVPGASALGAYHYHPWDTKLARSAKPYFLVQLCAYAEMLEAIQGVLPEELVFVLGNDEELRFQSGHFVYYYRRLKESFLAFQTSWAVNAVPDPGLDRSWGRWADAAEKLLAETDHLSRIANITRGQVKRFEDAGIGTLRKLAECRLSAVPRINPFVYERLRLQARLQIRSEGAATPAWDFQSMQESEPRKGLAVLPPPSAGDVFFDMEGFPFARGGLEYLFGAAAPDGETPAFLDWWAHDSPEEQQAFEGFIDWIVERRTRYPDLHIYHYAAYELSAVRRLMGKYGTREDEVDDLLRGDVFVDLYTIVKQAFVIGTPSYSLKEIERLYLPPRTGEVKSASGSVIEYQRWLDSGEPKGWAASPILRAIRDYNEVDCISTRQLRGWLLERQRERGIQYLPAPNEPPSRQKADEPTPLDNLAVRLIERSRVEAATDEEAARVTRLIAWLIEFHRREEKPMWWRMFERHDMSVEQRFDDLDCLANLTRTSTPPRPVKRSVALEYGFDPDQSTKLHADSKCIVAGRPELKCAILAVDDERGLVELKVGPGKDLPDSLCLLPDEFVRADVIKEAISRYAAAYEQGSTRSQAVDDLLRRRAPRVTGYVGGPLIADNGEFLTEVIDLAGRLDGTTLCIQGPPGTGKTFTAAAIIAELMRKGRRIGVTANSHKVILNLMSAVVDARSAAGESGSLYKVGDESDDPLVESGAIELVKPDGAATSAGPGVLIGGTAWVFSRPELAGTLDYLFVDEAGQFSLANAVAVGIAARNLILVGDQMQLAQPIQGTHPGESGVSCLDYLLEGLATVPPDRGVFLATSYRMHDQVCRFISEAIYDGRLGSDARTAAHRVTRKSSTIVPMETGIAWVPVEHDGCTQDSMEEVDEIGRIVNELLSRDVVDKKGGPRRLQLEDILVVAPFNMQVRRLRACLGPRARVGSVDLFQGQEAAVVIVSMCASSVEEAPRGAEFVLSPNRLNVAISRAQALAIVVGCPSLASVRCRSVEEMRLVNLLCRLIEYAGRTG